MKSSLLGRAVSMEDLIGEPVQVDADEAIADQADAGVAEAMVEKSVAEVSQAEDVIAALEDLVEIGESIDAATPRELVLIENAGRMALAGTDVEVEQILPSLESYEGGRVSMESIKDVIKSIWKSILRFVNNIWESIQSFFYKHANVAGRLQNNAEALLKDIKKLEGKGGKVKMPVGLAIEGSVPGSVKEVVDGGMLLATQRSAVMNKYLPAVKSVGEELVSIIDGYGLKNTEATLNGKLPKAAPVDSIVGLLDGNATRGGVIGTALPGNKVLLARANKGGDTPLASLSALLASGLSVTEYSTDAPTDEVEVEAATVAQMRVLLEQVVSSCSAVDSFNRSGLYKELLATKKKMVAGGDKIEKLMSGAAEDELSGGVGSIGKALMHANSAFARWFQPTVSMTSLSTTVSRLQLNLVKASIASYGKDK